MKARFARLIGMLLALAVVLSGCNLIEIDVKMQAEEDIAKIEKAYSAVVATYDGGEITANEAMSTFNSLYNEMYYMYQYYLGMEMTADQTRDLMQTALEDMIYMDVAAAHFDQTYTLSEAELAQAEDDARTYYDEAYAELYSVAEGKNDEAKAANALVMLKEVGMDEETNRLNTILQTKAVRMEEILKAEVSEISDEELLAAYEERVIADEETYSYPDGSFESAMMDENPDVCWIPDGYRTVKHILLIPEEDLMNAFMDASYNLDDHLYVMEELQLELDTLLDNDAETTEDFDLLRTEEEIRADIEEAEMLLPVMQEALETARAACLADVKDTSDEIYARLAAGEDFELLMEEYGEDPGMQDEPTKSRGYYVSAESGNWEQNFINGAMALENIGDYSAEPVIGSSGAHIIYYVSDVEGGAVPFETVSENLRAATLEEMQYAHCEETIQAWIDAVNPAYDVNAFEEAIYSSM